MDKLLEPLPPVEIIFIAGLIGLVIIAYLDRIIRFIKKKINLSERSSKKANKIIIQGGPNSFEDYLILFPNACPKCGSRDLVRTEWDDIKVVSVDWFIECSETRCYKEVCKMCHFRIRGVNPNRPSMKNFNKKNIRIKSPFLTEEQSETIPEFSKE